MTKLFRVGESSSAQPVPDAPFVDEVTDLEAFIKSNPNLLGEQVSVFAEQIDMRVGRMDLLALDESLDQGKLLLVELKNKPADVAVILQVLRYASWITANPDSIRLLLEQKGLNWQNADLKPRIVIAAPSIEDELIELSQYISAFEFAFLQVRRFQLGSEFLVAVDRKIPSSIRRAAVSAQGDWDWESYWQHLNVPETRVEIAKWLVEEMRNVCAERGWSLELRFRSTWTPFQMSGGWNVFGAQKKWADGWCIWFKLPSPPQEMSLLLPSWSTESEWSARHHSIYLKVPNKGVDLSELDSFFDNSHAYVAQISGASVD